MTTFVPCDKHTFIKVCKMWPVTFRVTYDLTLSRWFGIFIEVLIHETPIAWYSAGKLHVRSDYADFIRRSVV